MIGFEHYAKIRNNYCICYFGVAEEYLVQLKMLYDSMNHRFPDLNLYLGCKDESLHRLNGIDKILPLSQIKVRKRDFIHIKELTYDGKNHPVETFMKESDVSIWMKAKETPQETNKGVILTKGHYPTTNMMEKEISFLKKYISEKGYEPQVDADIENAGFVAGVENPDLFEAAYRGIKTALLPTGKGENLYRSLVPNGEIIGAP